MDPISGRQERLPGIKRETPLINSNLNADIIPPMGYDGMKNKFIFHAVTR